MILNPPAVSRGSTGNGDSKSALCLSVTPNSPFCAKGVFFVTGSYSCRSVGWEEIPNVLWKEFSLLKGIDSDVFPSVHEFATHEDACYYTMDYVQGPNLRTVLAEQQLGQPEQWLGPFYVLLQELDAIRRRHSNFYHGDVKPENLIVEHSGRLRLIDPAMRRTADYGFGMTLTLPYNPLGLTGPQADTFAITASLMRLQRLR